MLTYRHDGEKEVIKMIKFSNADDNKQFVTIIPNDDTGTNKIITHIIDKHPTIAGNIYAYDAEEILLNLYNAAVSPYDFSLSELKNTVAEISAADVCPLVVDMETEEQRVYC